MKGNIVLYLFPTMQPFIYGYRYILHEITALIKFITEASNKSYIMKTNNVVWLMEIPQAVSWKNWQC